MTSEHRDFLTPVSKGKGPAWLPLVLLLLALSSMFLFGGDRRHFYKSKMHNWQSSKNLMLAENLSSAHNFRLFERLSPKADGTPAYVMYSRFPVGGYALIKLAILPFDTLSAKIYAGRLLMLLLYSATTVVAYLAFARLGRNRWVALMTTLLAFSLPFLLYQADQICTEATVPLFAVMLSFHGMVVFVQEGHFRQLLGKTCLALLLSWKVYALLLPFVGFGLIRELVQSHKERSTAAFRLGLQQPTGRSGGPGAVLLRSRYLRLGSVALFLGLGILTFNFANEYIALGGEKSLLQLSSVRSMLARTGLGQLHTDYADVYSVDGLDFLRAEFARIGFMTLSHVLPVSWDTLGGIQPKTLPKSSHAVAIGIVVTITCLIGLGVVRQKLLLSTLALSGFCWVLPMRHVSYFSQGLGRAFYIGLFLVLCWLGLLAIGRWVGPRLVVGVAAAMSIFGLSSFQISRLGPAAEAAAFQDAILADFEAIRSITRGKNVFIATPRKEVGNLVGILGGGNAIDFYLSGSRILYADRGPHHFAGIDFVVSRGRYENEHLLTPSNRLVFLYDQADARELYESVYQTIVAREPAAHSTFDVYFDPGQVIYVKTPCAPADTEARFFLHVTRKAGKADVSPGRWHSSFTADNQSFEFAEHDGVIFDEKCLMTVQIPSFIATIHTGQYTDEGPVWQTEFSVEMP